MNTTVIINITVAALNKAATVIHITVAALHTFPGISAVLLLASAGFIAWLFMHEYDRESRWQ